MKINLFLDVDNVLLDWTNPFKEWLKKYHNIHLPKELDDYNFNIFDDVREKNLISQFNRSSYANNLPPMEGTFHYLNKIKTEFDIDKVICITAFCGIYDNKVNELYKHFPNIIDNVLFTTGDKIGYLSAYSHWKNKVWLEDNYENYKLGKEFGYNSFLMSYHHNIKYDVGDDRGCNWEDFYNRVRETYGG